ncbi:MAG: aspartate aminotransferase family protein [Gemmatimonadetes bacterium]|jgi:adenosylmethionine-8-amino-7-oxononanoate aminotransferase|nr:aspartate aminotransferase family protein [Gemmatimonadota bacterium]HCK08320.1 aspartate aminotransferase family protein [Candidatus Latescibacterota bacterium]
MSSALIDVNEIRQQDFDHVWHPMMQHEGMAPGDLMVVVSGDGCEVTDADGKTYLDAYAGIWNVNVGYGRQEIIDAVNVQMQELAFYPQTQISVPAARLAARLAELLPGDLNHLFFVNSGSEANETAIKVARQYGRLTHPGENRYKIICRYQGYHGFTMGAMSATGQTLRRSQYEPLAPGFVHVEPPSGSAHGPDEIAQVIEREGPDTVAAILAEPIIGGGGVLVPPDEYLPGLRELCDQYGLLLMLDEVITGFGRTGKLFACEHWGVVPDVMQIAKGLSSGYLPIGACAVSDKVFDAFKGTPDEYKEFSQVSTYGGHPACCAAALANLDILTGERLWENSAEVGAHLLDRLQEISSPLIKEVRGKGLMIAVELQNEDGSELDAARTGAFGKALRNAGVITGKMSHVRPGSEPVFTMSPPLILKAEQADKVAAAFVTALRAISQ